MASCTKVHKTKKKSKQRKAGKDRKRKLAKGTTPTQAIFFGDAAAPAK